MSDAIRIFLAVIYGIKAAVVVYVVSDSLGKDNMWPGTILTFTSICVVVMIATSPGRGR